MTATRHVVLFGLMGSGKSTVGRLLAAGLDRPFVDNDAALVARAGRSAREVAAADGPEALHRLEAEVLVAALAGAEPAVIAAAAAAPLEPLAAEPLAAHERVYLCVPPEVLAARLSASAAHDDGHRPFVDHDAPVVLAAQFAARDGRYRALATIVVDASGPAASIVDEISAALGRRASRTPPGS